MGVDDGEVIRQARERSGLSLRELAVRAGTSHSALSAYERGHKIPTTATVERICHAAGFAVEVTLRRLSPQHIDPGVALEAVLDLAEEFPTRYSRDPPVPIFARSSTAQR